MSAKAQVAQWKRTKLLITIEGDLFIYYLFKGLFHPKTVLQLEPVELNNRIIQTGFVNYIRWLTEKIKLKLKKKKKVCSHIERLH